MATITEDFISFETAKLLKEKNCPDFGYSCICDSEGNKAQTQSIIMKWLREVHNWTICISPYWPEGDMRNKLTWYYDIHSLIDNRNFRKYSYTDNYTEATEAAIKYCLEHLI